MQLLMSLLVVLIILILIYINIKRQWKLLDEAKKYEVLLHESRLIRLKYTQSLEKSREIDKEIEPVSNTAAVTKADLCSIRSEIRIYLDSLRKEIEKSTGSDLDIRTIALMKEYLVEKWKFLNSRKIFYIEIKAKLEELVKKKEQIIQEEFLFSSQWAKEKNEVMKLWHELNPKVKITDPHTFYT